MREIEGERDNPKSLQALLKTMVFADAEEDIIDFKYGYLPYLILP